MYCEVMEKDADPSYPPLEKKYANLLQHQHPSWLPQEKEEHGGEDSELPVIDLELLASQSDSDRQHCSRQIFDACSQWGFFQAINHGVSPNLFEKVKSETRTIFSLPFEVKNKEVKKVFTYAWATIEGAMLKNPNWMESFRITTHSIKTQSPSSADDGIDFSTFSATMEEYGRVMGKIACQILGVLASELDLKPTYFRDGYSEFDSYIKLNRYPPCKKQNAVDGVEPHTDNGLLTLIHQDHVGGLQILKNQKWVGVKPIQDALVINVGDLLQAWSNDVYPSVKHKVSVNCEERISVAYFVFPDGEKCILSPHEKGRHYRGFTLNDLTAQVEQDIRFTGTKIGLPHFRISS